MNSREHLEILADGNIAQRACAMLVKCMLAEGAHHKQWHVDQAIRTLAGKAYPTVIRIYEDIAGEKWGTGIAP